MGSGKADAKIAAGQVRRWFRVRRRARTSRCKVPTCMSSCDSMRERVGCLMPRLAATSSWVIPAASQFGKQHLGHHFFGTGFGPCARLRPHPTFKFFESSSPLDQSFLVVAIAPHPDPLPEGQGSVSTFPNSL